MIAAIGRFDAPTERWLESSSRQLGHGIARTRWLDHAAVERACEILAQRLIGDFGAHALRGFQYVAVPRGGLIVLGLLSYVLGLPQLRLFPPAHTSGEGAGGEDQPLVVVDDVAITGWRLSKFVAERHERSVIVATLHSHPEMRRAFRARHPRVQAFHSAEDLTDAAPLLHGADHTGWLQRWRSRVDPGAVWIGEPERIAYPWAEPDVGVWNPEAGREDPGWGLIPPSRCLKTRQGGGIAVQVMPSPPGPLSPAPDVIYGEHEGQIVIGDLASGESYTLEGSGAHSWRALVETGGVVAAAARLAGSYAAPAEGLEAELAAFTSDLLAAGLLVEADP
ncbi:MAG: PqqD family peptide modification chaperone [Trueperaceae bacterium]